MSRFKDFDAARSEARGEPIEFIVRGERFSLPPELPAIVPLDMLAFKSELGEDADMPPEAVARLIRGVFGSETQRLLSSGISMTELEEVLTWVMGEYGGSGSEESA